MIILFKLLLFINTPVVLLFINRNLAQIFGPIFLIECLILILWYVGVIFNFECRAKILCHFWANFLNLKSFILDQRTEWKQFTFEFGPTFFPALALLVLQFFWIRAEIRFFVVALLFRYEFVVCILTYSDRLANLVISLDSQTMSMILYD